MAKRGQITIFIILALVLILGVVAFFYLKQNTASVPSDFVPFKSSVDSCLKTTTDNALFYVLMKSGYYNIPPEFSLQYQVAPFISDETAFYYSNNETHIPQISEVENSVSSYIQDNLGSCVNFEEYRNNSYVIEPENLSVGTVIKNKEISVQTTITISRETTSVLDFSYKTQTDIENMLKASKEIADVYAEQETCITCIDDIAYQHNLNVTVIDYNEFFRTNRNDLFVLVSSLEKDQPALLFALEGFQKNETE